MTNRWLTITILAHIAALSFGLAGLLIVVPNPQLWADSDLGLRVYRFGMSYGGATHILFATIAMLIVGIRFLGLRRTIVFFALATVISLASELIGTNTGFPFGSYSYTSGLGYQILGDVPFTIPLSWFYMGLASYLLALKLAGLGRGWPKPIATVLVGAALLTVWDLALDPAMAHQQLDVRFWVWHQEGNYFGMPVQNFLGWMLVGTTFMGASRLAWKGDPIVSHAAILPSYVIYLANLVFAMVISGAVGLWWPVVITIIAGVVPATIALMRAVSSGGSESSAREPSPDSTRRSVSQAFMFHAAGLVLSRSAAVDMNGTGNLPGSGSALLVARHYHHLLDGCVLLRATDRPVHVLAAVDWAKSPFQRQLLEFACRLAEWPVVVRRTAVDGESPERDGTRRAYLRTARNEAVRLLAQGKLLAIFPEGYPTIDPHGSPKTHDNEILPFDAGFINILRAAEKKSEAPIPVIPVGLDYQRTDGGWQITVRFGAAIYSSDFQERSGFAVAVQNRVRALSTPSPSAAGVAAATEEVSESSQL